MYGYEEYIDLTPEQILQKVTQQEIIEFVLEQPFDFNNRYISPFRLDHTPGCRFEERPDGTIVFVDFGERTINPAKTHRSVFGMVIDKHKTTLTGAVRILCNHFKLSTNPNDYQKIEKIVYQKSITSSENCLIGYERRLLNKSDVWYWSQFIIKPEHLLEDNVFSASRFSIKTQRKFKVINVYKYCYVIDFLDRVKIYQPYNEKYRWITNCNENNIGNIDNLPLSGDELIIQKAYKDHRILRNLEWGLNVIWFGNEGCIPDIAILKNLTDRFKLITIFYDNDIEGIKAAEKLLSIFNMLRLGCARMVYLPLVQRHIEVHGKYLKDLGEFMQKEGKQDSITVLKQIGINGKNT